MFYQYMPKKTKKESVRYVSGLGREDGYFGSIKVADEKCDCCTDGFTEGGYQCECRKCHSDVWGIDKGVKYKITYGVAIFEGKKKVGEEQFETEQEMWDYINKREGV
jgi:hypothetical protein